jgi:predicted ArsR family transcriptional regulator
MVGKSLQAGDDRQRVAEHRRQMSKTLFGNMDRLLVAVAIARSDGAVNATDLSIELGVFNNRVRNQLVVLAEAGLLQAMPTADRKRWYLRRPSPFWDACLDLDADWGG